MTEKIVLTLTKHPLWGHVLQPVLVEENDYGTLSILEFADSKSSGFSQLNELSKKIVQLSEEMSDMALMTNFSKEKVRTIAAFQRKVTKDAIEKTIRPFIEDIHHKILLLLNDSQLPFYVRDNVKIRNLYETELAIIPKNSSKVIFNFTKEEEDSSIHYSIHVKWEDEELDLYAKPYFQICSEPAAIVINNKLLLFDDIDIKKLTPFFSKQEIEIPLSYEKTYIRTFIRNCLENQEITYNGLDIKEIKPTKKAALSLETDSNNIPVLNLTLNYEDEEYPLDCTSRKIVKIIENGENISLAWFHPDKKWEKTLTGMLLKGGLEKTGQQSFSLKKNKAEFLITKQIENMATWISQHHEVMKNFEFNQEHITLY